MVMVNVGFYNFVPAENIVAIMTPNLDSVERAVNRAKGASKFLDATKGRDVKGVIFTENGDVISSKLMPTVIANRVDF